MRIISLSLNKKDIGKGSLILVNKNHPIQAGTERQLTVISTEYPNTQLEIRAASMLNHLIDVVKGKEDIIPVSGYRSLEEQENIYRDSLKENGIDFTRKYVALPNHSEHQTGLAIDLAMKDDNIDFICPNFPYSGICGKFREEASRFGFIERYQEGKEGITGIAHEPWHFRYVGYPHSKIMMEGNYSLEEYHDFLKSHSYGDKHLYVEHGKDTVEVFYLPITSSITSIDIEEDAIHQVSGNNMDGFIITLWKKGA